MRTDGLFSVHEYRIPVKSTADPIRLIFFGDVHRDSPNHARSAWKDFLSTCRGYKDAYYLGMGDFLDSTSTTERACLGRISDELHETIKSDLNALQMAKVELLRNEMNFMAGHLIGLVGGNHFWQFQHGGTSDTELARLLGCKYLGCSSFIRVTLDYHGRHSTFDIWAHHGAGASRLPGGSLNRVEQMREFAEAEIFCMGHDHKRGAWPATPRLYLDNTSVGGLKVRERQSWLVRSGSFLASYEPGVKNYNVDACRGASSLGHVELHIALKKSGSFQEIQIHGYT